MLRLLVFFLVGLVSALAGVGGGVFFVPILLSLGYSPEVAVGTSSIAVAITTAIGGFGYYREGLYDKRITLKAALIAYPGVILGALLTVKLPGIVRPAISSMLFLSAFRAFKSFRLPEWLQVPGFFITGFFVGLLGIGGGAILTPVIVSTSPYDIIKSLGISYTTMPLLTVLAAMMHLLYGSADPRLGLLIGILSSAGAYTGAKIAGRIRGKRYARYLVGALMIAVALYILL